jgi:serine phosphatase RsbU (regulator of sigma subunit)
LIFTNRIVYGDTSLDNTNLRFLLIVYFFGGVCGVLATISNFILDLGIILTGSSFIMATIFFGLHRSLFKEWIGYIAGVRLFYFLAAFFFNLIWFVNAGLDGGILIFFYLLVIVIMIYSEGWERAFHLAMVMTNIIILLTIDYLYEGLAQPYPSRLDRYLDVFVSILISFVVNYIAISVVLTALNRSKSQLESKFNSVQKDMDLASRIQLAIMSTNQKSEFYDFASIYQPVSVVGGDLYSIDNLSSHKIRIFIADATGHGVQAALVTMLILSEYFNKKTKFKDPGKFLAYLNSAFIQHYMDIHAIFSAVILDWDFKKKEIQYSSAGHIPQILLQGTEPFFLERTGPIIGLKKDIKYTTKKIRVKSESKVLLFSDGITEAFNSGNEMFGEERIVSIVNSLPKIVKMEQILSTIQNQLFQFTNGHPLQDDLTILGIQPPRQTAAS